MHKFALLCRGVEGRERPFRVDNVTRHYLFTYALRGKGYGEGEKWMRRDFGVMVGELGSVNCGDRKRGGRGLNGEL